MKRHSYPLSEEERQILESIEDYRRSVKKPKGLLIASGPHMIFNEITMPVTQLETPEARELCRFYELNHDKQLFSASKYEKDDVIALYKLLKDVDGAANIDQGKLKAVKRSIKHLKHEGVIGGTRHQAGAYASTQGMKAYVLSEDMGTISLFIDGEQLMEEAVRRLWEAGEARRLSDYERIDTQLI